MTDVVLERTDVESDDLRLADLGLIGTDDLDRLGYMVETFLNRTGFSEVIRKRKTEILPGLSGPIGPSGTSGVARMAGPIFSGGGGGGAGGGPSPYVPGGRSPFSPIAGSIVSVSPGSREEEHITANYVVKGEDGSPMGEIPLRVIITDDQLNVWFDRANNDVPNSIQSKKITWDSVGPDNGATINTMTLEGRYDAAKEAIATVTNNCCDWYCGGKARYVAEQKKKHKRTVFDGMRELFS